MEEPGFEMQHDPSMMDRMHNFLKEPTWAVVGATTRTEKVGHTIFATLRQQGYQVYPVHPKYTAIDGVTCYPSVTALPVVPQVVDVVVPPDQTLMVLKECAEKGIRKIWMQPGTQDDRCLQLAETLDLEVVHNACVLIALREGLHRTPVQ